MHRSFASITTTRRVPTRLAAALLAAALAAACNDKKPQPTPTPPPAPAPAPAPVAIPAPPPPTVPDPGARQHVLNALSLLNQGRDIEARVEVVAALADRPEDTLANDLLRQIDTDPRVLLGTASYPYQIRRGESLSEIAGRYLGNRNRFWALARYNGIRTPETAGTGRTIQIPGTRPEPVRPVTVETSTRPAPAPAPVPTTVARSPAEAARLRRVGLAAMATGAIDRAVATFQRALSFDPGNPTILGDLARALRIQQTLRR